MEDRNRGLLPAGQILQKLEGTIGHPRAKPPESGQLSLFQNFLANTVEEKQELSNAIDLWDSIPRYSVSRQAMAKLRQARRGREEEEKGTTLKKVATTVSYLGGTYECIITPARVTDLDGVERDYYPSANEELVEDALRKIATYQHSGFFNKPELKSGVVFSLYGVREELARVEHARSCQEISLSLDIMNGSNIKIDGRNQRGEELHISSPYLPTLVAVSKSRLRDDPKAKWMAHFHPLVAVSINEIAYRQFNYGKMMRQKTHLARWLHKQLALKCTGADLIRPFEMRYSTIKRESKLLDGYSQERDAIKALVSAFLALKEREVLSNFDRKDITGPRKKLLDVVFNLWPSFQFVKEVKASNKRQKDALQQIDHSGLTRGLTQNPSGTGRGSL